MKKVTNDRRISFLDITYKVLSIVILKRLEIYAVDIEYQCGFKKGKSTTEHSIHSQLMEKYYENNKPYGPLYAVSELQTGIR